MAWIVHVPVARRVTVEPFEPLVAHTDGVSELKTTAKADEAVALTVNGDCERLRFDRLPKVIVWLALETVKLRVTEGAAA